MALPRIQPRKATMIVNIVSIPPLLICLYTLSAIALIMPIESSRPPKPRPSMIIPTDHNILSIPPRLSSESIKSTPVSIESWLQAVDIADTGLSP